MASGFYSNYLQAKTAMHIALFHATHSWSYQIMPTILSPASILQTLMGQSGT